MNKPIRLLLVDDHVVARNGVRMMLQGASDMIVVGEAETAREAIAFACANEVDVALIDINLPDSTGVDLIRLLQDARAGLAVIVISMYSEEMYAIRTYRNGAAAYLTKNTSSATLLEAVRKAAAGGRYVTPSTSEKLLAALGNEDGPLHDRLSDREFEVFKLLAAGESLVQIGLRLHVSASTVATYRARVLEKMNLKSNAQIARYALENRLLD